MTYRRRYDLVMCFLNERKLVKEFKEWAFNKRKAKRNEESQER